MEEDALQLWAGQQLEVIISGYACHFIMSCIQLMSGKSCLFFGVNKLIFGQTWLLNLALVSWIMFIAML